jgi:integrase
VDLLPRFERQWQLVGLKSLLHFCSELSIGSLSPEHRDFVAAFRLPAKDKYAALRSGDAFLTTDEERDIVDFIDDIVSRLRLEPAKVSSEELRDACILLISYQYGFRPTQIARLLERDARVYPVADGSDTAVHLTFQTVKQRHTATRFLMKRSVKREWTPLFAEHIGRLRSRTGNPPAANALHDSLFGLGPLGVSILIGDVTERITGNRRTATDLRHSAAQRMADAGATIAELAAFLGHTSLATALIYYDASPTQAEIVNKAMGLSPIYRAIAEVHHTRTIDKLQLVTLPPDHQIGAAPHGIPIAGIGACESGQSLCAKNPVISCYTCRKFLAVQDRAMHQTVLDSLRPVVRQFFDASRGEQVSPAFTQLSNTLAAVERVIEDCSGAES